MKILVFIKRFMSPTLLFIYNEIQELAKTNEVLLLTTDRVKEYEKDFPFENIKIIPFEINKVQNKINWILEKRDISINATNYDFSKRINRLVEEFKPDIIHAHFGYEAITLLDNLSVSAVPIVVSFHGYDASQMLKRKSYIDKLNFLFKKFNITPIYVSNAIHNDLVKAGVDMNKGRLLYYGTNTNYFNPLPQKKRNDKYTFLQISSFHEKKGHIYTLRAFKLFLGSVENKDKYRLILAGGFPSLEMLDNIKKETKILKLNDSVEFTGIITYKDAIPLLQQADAFVHHSVTASNGDKEGIPNAIMEAMAMELPVISTWHAGIPELVEDGVNGYLVKERDVETYAKRMKDILTWKRQPQNRLKVQEQFSVESHKKNLLNIYHEAILKRPGSAAPIKKVLFTFDYELFLGEKSGTAEKCLLQPTEALLEILKKYNAKGIFFADTMYILNLKKYHLQHDYAAIQSQLTRLHEAGHYVFPHIHPHWLDSAYLNDKNQFSLAELSRYSLAKFQPASIQNLFESSIGCLTDMGITYSKWGYRAGGWCIQPFYLFKDIFHSLNIAYDFSVLPGYKNDNPNQYFDFSMLSEDRPYHFTNEVEKPDDGGDFIEFPISTLSLTESTKFSDIITKEYMWATGDRGWGDGMGAITAALKVNLSNREMASIELLNISKIGTYKKFLDREDYMQWISHPKMLTQQGLKYFDEFLQYATRHYNLIFDFQKMLH